MPPPPHWLFYNEAIFYYKQQYFSRSLLFWTRPTALPITGRMALFIGLAYQGKKDIVFRFIIEYIVSLRDFYRPLLGNNNNNNNRSIFLYEDFWKMIFWLVLKLEISYRVTSLNPVPNAQVCVYLTVHITKLQLQTAFPKPLYIPHSACIRWDPHREIATYSWPW